MMFGLFKRSPHPDATAADVIYEGLAAQARDPVFYRDLGVPDTIPGRFEMIVLHAVLYFHRLKGEAPEAKAQAQEVFDAMFLSLDGSLRELGVGDLTVPKKIKVMANAFFDGTGVYDAALAKPDDAELTAALARIIYRDAPADPAGPADLAAYVRRTVAALRSQPVGDLVATGPVFPPVQGRAP